MKRVAMNHKKFCKGIGVFLIMISFCSIKAFAAQQPEFLNEFDREVDLYTYQKDPGHETVAAEIRKRVSGSPRIVDFVSQ